MREPTATGTADYDAVVVGASLAGLAAAAILSNRGQHVAVVDQLGYPGGKVGGTPFRDYWLDWGHRDGHGIGDLAFIAPHIRAAAEAAGVTVNLRPFTGECIRVHWLHEGRTSELPGELVTAGGDPLERVRALCHAFVGEAEATDATVEAVLDAQTRLGTLDDAEAWRLVTVKMGDWLRQNVGNAAASRVILQTLETTPMDEEQRVEFVGRALGAAGDLAERLDRLAIAPGDPDPVFPRSRTRTVSVLEGTGRNVRSRFPFGLVNPPRRDSRPD